MFRAVLRVGVTPATTAGNSLDVPTGDSYEWDDQSTYVRKPPYFEGMPTEPGGLSDVPGRRVLAMLADSVTTDHISPGRQHPPGRPGRPLAARRRRRTPATSTPTAPAGATTRS